MDTSEGSLPTGQEDGDDEADVAGLEQDIVFDLLQNSRRRALLRYLEEREEAELVEIAEHVAAEENDVELSETTEDSRRSVYISLYQTHVPKLADHGIIEYDEDEKLVSLRDPADRLLLHINLDRQRRQAEGDGSTLSGFVRKLLDR